MQNAKKVNQRREVGASQSRTGIRDQLQAYFSHHQQVASESIGRLLAVPLPSLMIWLVIGIAMALPGGLYVALENLERISRGWDGAAQISLYLHKEISPREGRALAAELSERADIKKVSYISPDEALEEFRDLSGYGDVLMHLNHNPLPSVIVVWPIEDSTEAEQTALLFQTLKALPKVEQAVIDMEWVQRLYTMMALGKRMTLALAFLLALGVLLVIGNTIRLAIENRRDEIVIIKLVGGTNAFVRRPFLYTGLWYGLGGGIIAWLVISLSLIWLSVPVSQLAGLYQSQFSLQGLGVFDVFFLWVSGGLLGLLGA